MDDLTPVIGAGFVGGGFMAAVHSRASRTARARLVGLASSNTARAHTSADLLGVERAYDSLDHLLASSEARWVDVPDE